MTHSHENRLHANKGHEAASVTPCLMAFGLWFNSSSGL